MKTSGARPTRPEARREPKTNRGRDTRDQILAAARELVSEKWVYETPFTELAQAAGVARASLLHAFPHWRDVLYDLFRLELDQLDEAYDRALVRRRLRASERVYEYLVTLIDRAEKSGRLYPNLRSAMFTWHGAWQDEGQLDGPLTPELLGVFTLYDLSYLFADIETLLGFDAEQPAKSRTARPPFIGECLVNFTLDLAAGSPSYFGEFDERRDKLRRTINCIVAGLRRTPISGRRRKRG